MGKTQLQSQLGKDLRREILLHKGEPSACSSNRKARSEGRVGCNRGKEGPSPAPSPWESRTSRAPGRAPGAGGAPSDVTRSPRLPKDRFALKDRRTVRPESPGRGLQSSVKRRARNVALSDLRESSVRVTGTLVTPSGSPRGCRKGRRGCKPRR